MRRRKSRNLVEPRGLNLSPKNVAESGWSSWEVAAVLISVCFLLYIWLCYENFHFHVTHLYAHLGYPSAQHIMGQRYLQGKKEELGCSRMKREPCTGSANVLQMNTFVWSLRSKEAALLCVPNLAKARLAARASSRFL
ncbi:uncharacterized protein LOC115474481 isoform X2 [Microcaecilia unicolor]|uniref:Uncharacterized protein LOC115474481 isoform X2 n=1 Tax=Microcaecilia unicolor TaxID=1415580 RepID=A0A6P7YLF3_9AMPH|nr:uncharacterized protein LOC115474481 isoform X2 [Microcaecilia unicolor]